MAKTTEETQIAEIPTDEFSLMRLAIEKGAGADELAKLAELCERIQAVKAKAAYASAVTAFQTECPAIQRNSSFEVKGGWIDYASMDNMMDIVQPIMAKHGISASWQIDHVEEGKINGICKIRVGAHSEDHTFKGVPIPPLNLSNTQAWGAALAYFERYTLRASLGIRLAKRDDEGMLLDVLTEEELNQINQLIKDKKPDMKLFLAFAGASSVEKILRKEFSKCVWALKQKGPIK